jgi:hypothetical protein
MAASGDEGVEEGEEVPPGQLNLNNTEDLLRATPAERSEKYRAIISVRAAHPPRRRLTGVRR